jgi:hypothetical protein
VLRDLDGTALVRIEICERGHEPTEWQLLRARYMAALVAAAEAMWETIVFEGYVCPQEIKEAREALDAYEREQKELVR